MNTRCLRYNVSGQAKALSIPPGDRITSYNVCYTKLLRDLNNLLHFLELRDSDHAQWEIREYALAIKKLIKPYIPNVAKYFESKGQVW